MGCSGFAVIVKLIQACKQGRVSDLSCLDSPGLEHAYLYFGLLA